MGNNINGVIYPGNVVIGTSAGDPDDVDATAVIAVAAAQPQPRSGQSIVVTGNGRNVAVNGAHAGNNTR